MPASSHASKIQTTPSKKCDSASQPDTGCVCCVVLCFVFVFHHRAFMYIEKDEECWTAAANSKVETILRRTSTALYEKQGRSLWVFLFIFPYSWFWHLSEGLRGLVWFRFYMILFFFLSLVNVWPVLHDQQCVWTASANTVERDHKLHTAVAQIIGDETALWWNQINDLLRTVR